MPASVDDGLLQAWAATRDEPAFRELCARHTDLVASLCRRLGSPDPDEATQAVFLVLARRAGSVAGPSLACWLGGTARRVVADQRRAAASRRRHEEEAAMEHARHRDTAPAEPAWVEAREHLDAALASLSTGRREAVLRFYLGGRSQAEVAAELGCSEAAVKTRVHAGLERLRAFFARKGVALGAAAIASGLAGESAAAEPALAASCAQAAFQPASAAGAATLASGVTTAMFIKSAALACAAVLVVGSALTVALVGGAETVQPALPPVAAASLDPNANAALDWWRAMDAMPKEDDPIWKLANLGSPLPDPVIDIDTVFGGPFPPLDLLALGAANSYCTWGVDAAQEGTSFAAPYLGKMRSLVRLAILRARWHAARGEQAAAVDDLLTVLRAARLLPGRKPLIIDFIMGVACERTAIEAVARIVPQLDAEHRQRLRVALVGLPDAVVAAEVMDSELGLVRSTIGRLQALPMERRAQFPVDSAGKIGVPDLTDASLKLCLDACTIEFTRWKALLRRPPIARLHQEPRFTTGEHAPHPLLGTLAPAWDGIASAGIQAELLRDQLQAVLAYLDRGEAGLAAFPDPLTGKPFRLEKSGSGFRLLADLPGMQKPLALEVGDTASPP